MRTYEDKTSDFSDYLERRKERIRKLVSKMTENTEEGLSQTLLVQYASEYLIMKFENSGEDHLQDAWDWYMTDNY